MVAIIDNKKPTVYVAERNVLEALHLTTDRIKALRWAGGQYKAALIGKRKSQHVGVWDGEGERPARTSNEKHHYQWGYGRGYEDATKAILELLAGEEGHGMYKAWAEPLED